ncbi:TIGR04283 family arsenosugar biosynthesis glycosyltransferase [Abyssalbus ytuae]|uniref:TIGR04283 family arsenosugar biosynthesis glycosyltransferase n=1 Tax=Abyssalbus ytuae TaxID=2926907 RepID=A0A9E7D4C4_9FLAO|nr:TIGR04283 family arsenosugar biosynthesis glycosyltransferase [Abyssalbus ytuae]UOB18759.1 TIGR04283 family arsenosugar biosynthesis glycosyltransferase [Abyssalbus ytuae]
MNISVIIPVLNEAGNIGNLLSYLIQNSSSENIGEIIIVDGGSNDGSQDEIKNFTTTRHSRVKLINSPKGRAKQMNYGAGHSSFDILYFLHADSYPPKNFDQLILHEVKKGFLAGCFRMKFDSTHPVLKFSGWFTRFNLKSCRGGDQSLFITRTLFEKLKGYDEKYIVYEDCEFINRIYSTTNFKVIPEAITTSARRYKINGTWKLQYHFMVIHLKKWLGASPYSLYKYYLENIVS